MMPDFQFQYPAWLLVFCALLGLGYAALLYYRDTTFKDQPVWVRRVMAILRWLAVTLLSALLLSPLVKRTIVETKKPVIVLAQDQSESVGTVLGGAALEQYKQDWAALRTALNTDYEVHELACGDQVREGVDFNFNDKVSNLSELLRDVYDRYGAQNLGAIVVASDGIYNEGSNPAYSGAQVASPIYAVALGDTTPRKDLVLKRVFHNNIAYLGDKFTLQVDVAASNCSGTSTVLSIGQREGDQVRNLQNIPINISGRDFFVTREVQLEATQPGVAQYVVTLSQVSGEASTANNTKEIFVDVLDARQKILLLANSPHPDLSALRQMLELNKNYAVTLAYAGDAGVDVTKYDFVVLHNLPSRTNDAAGVLRNLQEKRIPRLFIAGMQTNFAALSAAQDLAAVQSDGNQSDDVQGKVSPKFASFSISPRTLEELPKFNPVQCPFGNFAANNPNQVVLRKRIGKVDTEQPLLVVGESAGTKVGLFLGEGLWRWRMFDFLQHQNYEIFDEVFGKTIQYLALKEDKRKFRVTLPQTIFNENEAVQFGAELYNDNYELTNEPDVAVSVRHQDGREFTFTFNKSGKAYALNAGILPVGNYTYRAATTFNGQQLTFDGRFSVRPLQLELFETTANHAVLRQLAERHGGEFVYAGQLASIAERIKANATVKPVAYQTSSTNPIINLRWIFAILAGLLALEWFMRRYYGAY
jgi:hypothetical protein